MHTTPRWRARIEAAGLLLLKGVFYPLPLRWASALGAALGWFLFAVLRLERRTAQDSLRLAFGAALSEAERARLAGRAYRHFGAVIAEFLCQPRLAGRNLERYMALDNPELVDAALEQGRGLLLVAGHLGNWELLMAAVAARRQPFASYVGRQHNPIADGLVNGLRRAMGIETIHRQSGMRGMLRALKAGSVLAMATDQHFSRMRHYVNFFGRPVSVAPGMAALIQHMGVPALFTETWCVGPFRYRTRFVPIPVPAPSGDAELDLLRISKGFFDLLEAAVRRHPEQYFWMHRRWRTPPTPAELSPANRAFLHGSAPRGAAGGAAGGEPGAAPTQPPPAPPSTPGS